MKLSFDRYKNKTEEEIAREISQKLPPSSGFENKVGKVQVIQSHENSITCRQLYEFISNPNTSLLILDCRSAEEFEASKLLYKNLLNVPEEIIHKG